MNSALVELSLTALSASLASLPTPPLKLVLRPVQMGTTLTQPLALASSVTVPALPALVQEAIAATVAMLNSILPL